MVACLIAQGETSPRKGVCEPVLEAESGKSAVHSQLCLGPERGGTAFPKRGHSAGSLGLDQGGDRGRRGSLEAWGEAWGVAGAGRGRGGFIITRRGQQKQPAQEAGLGVNPFTSS